MRNFRDYLRCVNYFLTWLFVEKSRGLDFSLRDLSVIKNKQMHGSDNCSYRNDLTKQSSPTESSPAVDALRNL